jgi:hypothetical protein
VHPASGQVSIGAMGGVRVSNEVFGNISSESKRYLIGPRVDVHLPHNFFVEVEALYRPFGFTAYQVSNLTNEIIRERANSWEIPILLKYRYTGFRAHPFIGAGYDPRFVHGTDVTNGAFQSGVKSGIPTFTFLFNQQTPTNYPVSHGAVVSGGVEFIAGPIRISPELRYTHWNPAFLNFNHSQQLGPYRYNSAHNELSVMFGVTWH